MADASARLQRFAPLIARLFPETAASGGIIESDLVEVATFHDALRQHYAAELPGRLWLKRDSHLPISGSIKARGGVYKCSPMPSAWPWSTAWSASTTTTRGWPRRIAGHSSPATG